MENQINLFCNDEKDHNFQIVSHSCEIEVEVVERGYGNIFTGVSTLVLLCKHCGKEETRVVKSQPESYIE